MIRDELLRPFGMKNEGLKSGCPRRPPSLPRRCPSLPSPSLPSVVAQSVVPPKTSTRTYEKIEPRLNTANVKLSTKSAAVGRVASAATDATRTATEKQKNKSCPADTTSCN